MARDRFAARTNQHFQRRLIWSRKSRKCPLASGGSGNPVFGVASQARVPRKLYRFAGGDAGGRTRRDAGWGTGRASASCGGRTPQQGIDPFRGDPAVRFKLQRAREAFCRRHPPACSRAAIPVGRTVHRRVFGAGSRTILQFVPGSRGTMMYLSLFVATVKSGARGPPRCTTILSVPLSQSYPMISGGPG